MRGVHLHDASLRPRSPLGTSLRQRPQKARQGHDAFASTTLKGDMGEAMASTKIFAFETYVDRFLAATLEEGQIVIKDNLGATRRRESGS